MTRGRKSQRTAAAGAVAAAAAAADPGAETAVEVGKASAVTAARSSGGSNGVVEGIEQAESDPKLYRLVYMENGMRVLLIHDPPRGEHGDDEGDDRGDDEGSQGHSEGGDDSEDDSDDDEGSDGDMSSSGDEGDQGGRGSVQKAAAAMTVGVGSFSDPPECHGLAHYLEHMLFMGSKKYPEENGYDAFISLHGGSTNAMTESEMTLYYFDIVPERLDEALDRFAQFFICPIMNPDSSDRELQSIEEEFSLSRNSDGCRLQGLRCHTSKPGHPASKFNWGNLASLRDEPQAAGVDVREALLAFHERYYRAPLMQLAVLGTQSLDELQAMVEKHFASVRADPVPPPPADVLQGLGDVSWKVYSSGNRCQYLSFATEGPPLLPEALGQVYRVQPIRDRNTLTVTWQLLPQLEHYRSNPCEYMGHVIGHEGSGSLLSLLRLRGWATGVVAGVCEGGMECNSACALFSVVLSLTEEGMRRWEDVIEALFQLLGVLRDAGPQRWIHEELRDLAALSFRFQQEQEPVECVESVAIQMLPAGCLEEAHILSGPYKMDVWSPELVQGVMEVLTPGNVRIDLQSSSFGKVAVEGEAGTGTSSSDMHVVASSEPPLREPRFDVCYWKEDIAPQTLAKWELALVEGDKGLKEDGMLTLPERNAFIPADVTVKPLEESFSPPELAPPVAEGVLQGISMPLGSLPAPKLAFELPGVSVWHLQDYIFRQPRAELYVKIICPDSFATARVVVLRELLVRLVNDSLMDYSYAASLAELQYRLKAQQYGFQLRVWGFSDKLPVLACTVLTRLVHFGEHLKENAFNMHKEALCKSIANENLKSGRQVTSVATRALRDRSWGEVERAKAIEDAQLIDIKSIIVELFGSKLRLEALIHGNATGQDAKALAGMLSEVAGPACLQGSKLVADEPRLLRISPGTIMTLAVPSKDPSERNHALEIFWEMGHDDGSQEATHRRVLLDVIEYLMEEPLYDQLRTKEQLGYSVGCESTTAHATLSFIITVQSASHEGPALVNRVFSFLEQFRCTLRDMPDEHFEDNLASLAHVKLQRDNMLGEEAGRHWTEIVTRRLRFHSRIQSALQLEHITRRQILEKYEEWFIHGASCAGALVAMVVGSGNADAMPAPEVRHTVVDGLKKIRPNAAHVLALDPPESFLEQQLRKEKEGTIPPPFIPLHYNR